MSNTITRKIQLFPVGDKEEIDRVYKYLRDGIFNQNKAMNQYMSALYMSEIEDISKEDRKELNRLYTRISESKKGSAYSKDIQFPKGLPIAGNLGQAVRQDFSNACKDGLLYGKISLPTYRKDNPLLVHVDYVRLRSTNPHNDTGIYHNYESHAEFLEYLYSNDLEVFIKFANRITFKMVLGTPYKSRCLREEIKQIFEENYKVCGSSIQITKNGKIILNLTMEIPQREIELDENVVVGVDLGVAVPAVCSLNTDKYKREFIGCKDDFLKVRTQIQSQFKQQQKALKMTSCGHGKKKKLKPLERFKNKERNFVQTYNHKISKNIIDFAIKNKAKYINIECLTGFNTSNFILRNWSYYELQNFITYKAKKYGIEVRKINPCYTSQVCSCCGHWEEGQRIDQSHFKCKSCGAELNADFNASRNIAKSTLWCDKKVEEKQKKEAREYYGIIKEE